MDLFSGIGGLTIALQEWVNPVAYCEIDRYCQAVLLSNMADSAIQMAPIWDNISTLCGEKFNGLVDIIYGGFPCQDISIAGNGVGLEGKRSKLFFELLRLCREIRPTFIFMENVPALITRGIDRILLELDEIGYDARWTIVSAAEIGAEHVRERLFLLAYTNRSRCKYRLPGGKAAKQAVPGSVNKRYARNGCKRRQEPEPLLDRVYHALPYRTHRIKALGNSVVTAQAREAFVKLMGIKK